MLQNQKHILTQERGFRQVLDKVAAEDQDEEAASGKQCKKKIRKARQIVKEIVGIRRP
jgi:hypothetical protein